MSNLTLRSGPDGDSAGDSFWKQVGGQGCTLRDLRGVVAGMSDEAHASPQVNQ